jgi:hypothetical protein
MLFKVQTKSYGPYSLKHSAINKLFGLGLNQSQINKVAHYNPTSSNLRALSLLIIKETNDIIPQLLSTNQQQNKIFNKDADSKQRIFRLLRRR